MIDFASPAFPIACSAIFLAILINTISWSFLIISTIDTYKSFKNKSVEPIEIIEWVVCVWCTLFFTFLGYITTLKFIADFIK